MEKETLVVLLKWGYDRRLCVVLYTKQKVLIDISSYNSNELVKKMCYKICQLLVDLSIILAQTNFGVKSLTQVEQAKHIC